MSSRTKSPTKSMGSKPKWLPDWANLGLGEATLRPKTMEIAAEFSSYQGGSGRYLSVSWSAYELQNLIPS